MTRVKRSVPSRARRKRIMLAVRGYRGARRRLYKSAKEALMHAGMYAYIHRRTKKRDFRRLWIARISAIVHKYGLNYSEFMHNLKTAGILLDRKQLAFLAVTDENAFAKLIELAKGANNH